MPDTVRIALSERIEPLHAPVPRSDSERILFGHLFETLINIDCEGSIRPCLASDWYPGEGGGRWTFRLRRDARFWDGSPVTPRDVVDCWQSAAVEPFVWEAGVDSVAAAGGNMLHVYFTNPHKEVPRELTAPPFYVSRRGSTWPLGSTPGRIDIEPAHSSQMYRRPFTISPPAGTDRPVLVFLEPGTAGTFDSRDLLEGPVDVMVTYDPEVIEYASGRPHLETVHLPWSRTYVLLSTTRVREIRLGDTPPGVSRKVTDGLARDAVRGAARGHQPSRWWKDIDWCAAIADGAGWSGQSTVYAPLPAPGAPDRIVYVEDDPAARGLAERIVGLGASGPGSSADAAALSAAIPGLSGSDGAVTASGMPEPEFRASIEEGGEFAYIVSFPMHPADPCGGVIGLVQEAGWLSRLGGNFSDALLPLIDTRGCAIVRKGTVGLTVDWYGDVFITGALSRPEAAPPGR
jgi:hypothetical protein